MSEESVKSKLGRKDRKITKTKIFKIKSNTKLSDVLKEKTAKFLAKTKSNSNIENGASTSVGQNDEANSSKRNPQDNRQKGGEIAVVETNLKYFKVLYVFAILIGITLTTLIIGWIFYQADGIYKEFKVIWHPILMTIAIFVLGNAILVYRGFRHASKKHLKIAHAILHLLAIFFTIAAVVPVFYEPGVNLYSLHSWLGSGAVGFLVFQYLAGFFAYVLPILKDYYSMSYMPIHIFFGSFTFVLFIATALTGITQKVMMELGADYQKSGIVALLANSCGVAFVFFGGFVLFISSFPMYKRRPLTLDYFTDLVNTYLEDKFNQEM